MRLHLGHTRLDGFINIDVNSFNYPDNSIDYIYSNNTIEHLDKHEAIDCLAKCYRVLRPMCQLKLEFIGLDLVMKSWVENTEKNIDVDTVIINALYGIQRHSFDYHRYGYTKNSMSKLLIDLGFRIEKYEKGRTGYPKNTVGWKVWARKV